jgi:EpsI family protein
MTVRLYVLALVFVAATGVIAKATKSEPVSIRNSFVSFPMTIDAWNGRPGEPFDPKILKVLGVDEYLNMVYSKAADAPIGLYVGYYKSQREGDTMHSPLNCLPGAGWAPESQSYLTIPVSTSPGAAPEPITVNRYLIRKGADRQLVLYWYQSHGRVVASEYSSKVFMVLDAIRTSRTDGALVRVITPAQDEDPGAVQAEKRAVGFIQGMVPVLRGYLPS